MSLGILRLASPDSNQVTCDLRLPHLVENKDITPSDKTNKSLIDKFNYEKQKSNNHLKDINKTYCEHLGGALFYSSVSIFAGFVFIIHGLFPNILVYNGSSLIKYLNKCLDDSTMDGKKE